MLFSQFGARAALCCRVGGNQDARPPARKRRRANTVHIPAVFGTCADFEIFRHFGALRDRVQTNPSTQLDIFRDFRDKLKLGATESRGVSRPRRLGGIVSALVTVRCPGCTLLLGRRNPGCGAFRGETAACQLSASHRRVSRLCRFRDFSTCPDFTRSRTA